LNPGRDARAAVSMHSLLQFSSLNRPEPGNWLKMKVIKAEDILEFYAY